MKFSLNWLIELVDINVSTDQLVTLFNLKSAEVEDYYQLTSATGLTVGLVLTCILHPQSNHLHICEVKISDDSILQIVCGAPNVNVGQKVIVALEGAILPGDFVIRKSVIRGIESNGMICSLDELGIDHKFHQEDGIHVLPLDTPIGSNPLHVMYLEDTVIDQKLTPNRGDMMSMMGVAYDVSAMLDSPIHLNQPVVVEIDEKIDLKVSTLTSECKSYYARIIKNVKIQESPVWIKSRLIAAGIRPINNVVDITNYVMIETGQPLHAFDFDKLNSHEIVVRKAENDKKFLTLDGKYRDLSKDDLLITDGKNPIALAGVMGGASTQIDETTQSILLESAVFDNLKIRKTSQRLDLRSESSIRFERGLDPNRTLYALNRAAELLQSIGLGTVVKGISSFESQNLKPSIVKLPHEKLNKVTGYCFKTEQVIEVLNRLNFKSVYEDGIFIVTVPTRRIDILTYQDLIEEIVRIAGYELIPTTLQASSLPGQLTQIQSIRRTIRDTLITLGLNETISYSLTSESEATLFDQTPQPIVKLLYPIAENKGTMRHSQLPALLEIFNYNQARKQQNIALFEIGKGYFQSEEIEYVSGILSGYLDELAWQGINKPIDFYTVKGLLSALFQRIGIKEFSFLPPQKNYPQLHPGICAEIISQGEVLGFIGKIHPSLQTEKGISEAYVFEIGLRKLSEKIISNQKVKEISKFPMVSRDLAIVVDKNITADQVTQCIKKGGGNMLADVHIFDLYVGDKIEIGKKSIAFTLSFQDFSKTLSTDEVDNAINQIIQLLLIELKGTLRV
jgi:phenylalanyl-tRNA synthetase beta chain